MNGNRKGTWLRGGKVESKNWIAAIATILNFKTGENSFCYDEKFRDGDS